MSSSSQTVCVILLLALTSLSKCLENGLQANENQFPHMASLFDNRVNSHVCGGAIITNRHILSAQTCYNYYKSNPSHLSASIGSSTFNKNAIIKPISTIIIYSKHDDSYHNDLAILKTIDAIEFTEKIQPIPLPTANVDRFTTEPSFMCGFGAWFVSII